MYFVLKTNRNKLIFITFRKRRKLASPISVSVGEFGRSFNAH